MAPFAPPVSIGGSAQPAPGDGLRLQILGPLRIWRNGYELDPGPRQQTYLLALLVARAGQPISLSELIDLIWGEEVPSSAVNVLQKYIGALRRLLEPTLPIRSAGSYLQRRGNGYVFVADSAVLDVVAFRAHLRTATRYLAAQRRDAALDSYLAALRLWRGPVGDGLTHGAGSVTTFASLDGEFVDACAAAADLAVSFGRPADVLQPLQLAASMAPLHEPAQAALMSALVAAGRQAEAVSMFGTIRGRLADELGIDPGPALQAAYQRLLSQTVTSAGMARPTNHAADHSPTAGGLVGRADELSVLRQAVASVRGRGTGLVLVEGEPGVGKTRLLEEAAAEAAGDGVFVVWGQCLEGDGTPAMWPWVQVIGAVLDDLPPSEREAWIVGELGRLVLPTADALGSVLLPDSAAQFRLFEQVVAVIGQAAAKRGVMLVIDDLQWADVTSLHLFGHLAARLPSRVAVVGAFRTHAPVPGSELTGMLAAASRVPGQRRIRLGPLAPAEVAELIRRETGRDPGTEAADSIHARTAGNPFFVRELSRLLVDNGSISDDATTRAGVPATVRDVVRSRISGLDDAASGLLEIAAVVGRNVDLGLLTRVADVDAQTCLVQLEPVEELGLLGPVPGDPFSLRFAHDLVREAVAGATTPRRATHLHLRVADALEHSDPGGETVAERLAHHLWSAGPLADPARTASALIRAGHRAAAKSALEDAERLLRSAAEMSRSSGLAELELSALWELTVVVGMRKMFGASALDLLQRAETLARGLGRELQATDFLFTRWAALTQGIDLARARSLARRLLDQAEQSSDPTIQAYGWYAWGINQWDVGNVGEAFRYMSRSSRIMFEGLAEHEVNPLRYHVQLLMTGILAETTAQHGDVAAARALFDEMETAAGNDRYAVAVWASNSGRTASLVGDPAWAMRAGTRGIAADPEFSFAFLGTYHRLARCWASAMTGLDPAGAAAEAEAIIMANLLDPPRSGIATWYGLLGEMHLAADQPDQAAAALDRADHYLGTYGQRYAEGLILLLRARVLLARGEPVEAVRAAAERARAVSLSDEAHLFARRAAELLAGLGS